ncbi:unnamed protein product [Calicophoron daubneyi]|uniref:Large ribosomal subunit protein uL14m n=1 Tax=Calicophoron daubneyi TaxID=300641 RepID=A0AAV2TXI5_CALDB
MQVISNDPETNQTLLPALGSQSDEIFSTSRLLPRVWTCPYVPGSRLLWTSISPGHSSLNFIAPQTRLRIVDNSPWSSIAPAPTVRDQIAQKGGLKKAVAAAAVRTTPMVDKTGVVMKPGLCIRVYNSRNKGVTGDKVLVAVGGEKMRGWIVGTRQPSKDGWPRFESNNIVLVDDDGNPLGTRILVPIPAKLRSLSGDITKILSIATTFV